MFEFVKSLIGEVPPEFTIIYIICTLLLFTLFARLIFLPFELIFSKIQPRRRVNLWFGIQYHLMSFKPLRAY